MFEVSRASIFVVSSAWFSLQSAEPAALKAWSSLQSAEPPALKASSFLANQQIDSKLTGGGQDARQPFFFDARQPFFF